MSENTQARITSVTPQAAEMGAKVPGVHIPPRTQEEYNSPEVQEILRNSRAYEASVRPHAERMWRQYTRGLTTFWEMVADMAAVDERVRAHAERVRDLQDAGWTINPELVDHVEHAHKRLLASGWVRGF